MKTKCLQRPGRMVSSLTGLGPGQGGMEGALASLNNCMISFQNNLRIPSNLRWRTLFLTQLPSLRTSCSRRNGRSEDRAVRLAALRHGSTARGTVFFIAVGCSTAARGCSVALGCSAAARARGAVARHVRRGLVLRGGRAESGAYRWRARALALARGLRGSRRPRERRCSEGPRCRAARQADREPLRPNGLATLLRHLQRPTTVAI